MSAEILVVDDEAAIADLVELYLRNEGFTVHKFSSASPALSYVEHTPPDLAILDVMLPDMDGFTLCQRIRERHLFPIIMLTARMEDMDKITGLTLGADDYITKPFNPLELTARVKTQLRRCTRYNQPLQPEFEEYDIRGLQISRETHKCFLYEEELALTPAEEPVQDAEREVLVQRLADALEGAGELELLEAAMELDVKRGREELSALLAGLETELGVRAVRGGRRKRLFRAADLVRQLRSAAGVNVGGGQLSGWLCAGMFEELQM